MGEWAFRDPPDRLVWTLREILDGGKPILEVAHIEDGEDDEWQFLTGDSFYAHDMVQVPLSRIVTLDPSVVAVADLCDETVFRRDIGGDWLIPDEPDSVDGCTHPGINILREFERLSREAASQGPEPNDEPGAAPNGTS